MRTTWRRAIIRQGWFGLWWWRRCRAELGDVELVGHLPRRSFVAAWGAASRRTGDTGLVHLEDNCYLVPR